MEGVSSESMPVLDSIKRKLDVFCAPVADEDVDSAATPIFPIPSLVRQTDRRLYEPTLLSIGPYHRDKLHLRAFDQHKAFFLHKLLIRDNTWSLADCVTAVMNLEPEARRCYEDTETFRLPSSRDDLVELLVMDGCFIIELFYKFFWPNAEPTLSGGQSPLMVWTDLLKLENQIPFFVLEALFELRLFPLIKRIFGFSSRQGSNAILRYFAVSYLTNDKPEFRITVSRSLGSMRKVHHLLHLYYLCLTPHPQEEGSQSSTRPWNWILRCASALADNLILLLRSLADMLMVMIFSPHRLLRCILMMASACFCRRPVYLLPRGQPSITIPCATQLEEDGVKLVNKRKWTCLCDITFNRRRGILQIPLLSINSESITLFSNLIQCEQRLCKGQKKYEDQKKYIISYAFLMDCLVKSPKDVMALRKREIIVSDLDDKEVAEFFKQIRGMCDVIIGPDYYYARLSCDVREYRKFKLHRWRAYFAKLKRDYFGSPWALISFLAALILLSLTIAQTFFTIYPYYHPR